ncbi:hypothetical protein VDGE_30334 [Verticillium dahliae]|uniref:Uncharacterized protein n=1 Tax=Verticillium dahliae TaxID=27337 RepID=A0A444S0Q2_VERDA|nr:hypothetical protein VDGE_30334 [Verticillium dahliae]
MFSTLLDPSRRSVTGWTHQTSIAIVMRPDGLESHLQRPLCLDSWQCSRTANGIIIIIIIVAVMMGAANG